MPLRSANRALELDESDHGALKAVRRGRRALLADPDVKQGQVNDLRLTEIRPGDNDRTVFDQAEIESLAASIKDVGLAQPILVRPINHATFRYEIVAGERRFRAIQFLNWERIPAVLRTLSDEQASSLMLAENVHRVDIDPIDEANAYAKRMDKFHWSCDRVAKEAKISAKRVKARLDLLKLLPEMQRLIQTGAVGVQFGEVMAVLDVNRQRIALQYLSLTEHPLLREFKSLVGKLAAEQAQEPMFDAEVFIRETVEGHNTQRTASLKRRFPLDPVLPPMERTGSIGATLEAYLKLLLQSDDAHLRDVAAPIVATVYDGLLRGGMAFPPNTSSKRKDV